MNIATLAKQYLDSKEHSWAITTRGSESARLKKVLPFLDGNPLTLWHALLQLRPYTRVTTWTRVSAFWDWCIARSLMTGPNPYSLWREENERKFKYVYMRNKPALSYAQAEDRIGRLPDGPCREAALMLLRGGLRFCELETLTNDGRVVGKGSKPRQVYVEVPAGGVPQVSYDQLHRALAALGLKPHDLRKLFLSRLVEEGANEFELCEVAGWSNIATASSYIKVNQDRVRSLVAKVQGGTNGKKAKVSRRV